MKQHALTLPEIGLIGGTRVALGLGLALLLAGRLSNDARRATAKALRVTVGDEAPVSVCLGDGRRSTSAAFTAITFRA